MFLHNVIRHDAHQHHFSPGVLQPSSSEPSVQSRYPLQRHAFVMQDLSLKHWNSHGWHTVRRKDQHSWEASWRTWWTLLHFSPSSLHNQDISPRLNRPDTWNPETDASLASGTDTTTTTTMRHWSVMINTRTRSFEGCTWLWERLTSGERVKKNVHILISKKPLKEDG